MKASIEWPALSNGATQRTNTSLWFEQRELTKRRKQNYQIHIYNDRHTNHLTKQWPCREKTVIYISACCCWVRSASRHTKTTDNVLVEWIRWGPFIPVPVQTFKPMACNGLVVFALLFFFFFLFCLFDLRSRNELSNLVCA